MLAKPHRAKTRYCNIEVSEMWRVRQLEGNPQLKHIRAELLLDKTALPTGVDKSD